MVQGGEGGGHTGAVPTTLLLPQVVDAVDIPVVAAGGFFDGRGLVAALAYGAEGDRHGHPLPAHQDSTVGQAVKEVYLGAGVDGTVVTTRVDGMPHRVLRTELVDQLVEGRPDHPAAAGSAQRQRVPEGERDLVAGPAARRAGDEGAATSSAGARCSWPPTPRCCCKASMVDGRADLGLMTSGQVVGADRRPAVRRGAHRPHRRRGNRHTSQAATAGGLTCTGHRRMSVRRLPWRAG